MKLFNDTEIHGRICKIIPQIGFDHCDPSRIFCVRSFGAKTRAIARIWSLPLIWRQCLGLQVYYIIEVVAEKFGALSNEDKDKVLIHELLHIPAKFSGGLVPHQCFGKRIDKRRVDDLYNMLLSEYKQQQCK